MNNLEKIKAMSLNEFTAWLDKYGQFDGSPWMTWFNNNYCAKCEAIKCISAEADEKLNITSWKPEGLIECAYCELEKKCKYFPALNYIPDNKDIIEMWLLMEVEL